MSTKPTPKQRLLTPGPTAVPDAVLEEMARPMVHHRTEHFRDIFDELCQRLQHVFRTGGPVLSMAGSGTTAFEAALISLACPQSCALTVAAGKFGERWQDVHEAYGIDQVRLNVAWGDAPTAGQIGNVLAENPQVSVVTVVASETSTATACDLRAIARVVSQTDALLVVDGITAVGALPVEMDEWGIDLLVCGSQKALMLPPGLGYVALGRRALRRLDQQKPYRCYGLDLRRWLKSWQQRDVPFTPPISLIRAQRLALQMIENEGLPQVWARTARMADACRVAFRSMGLELISRWPSDSVTGAFYPEGIDDQAIRRDLRQHYGIHIAGGQDGRGARWSGRVMRISHMGYVDDDDIRAALVAIETELIRAGHGLKAGAALEAAEPILAAG